MLPLHSRRRRTLPAKAGSRPIGRWRRLELLEDRAVPATIQWSGGAHDSNWLTPSNWVGGVLPGPADDAVIANNYGPPGSIITLAGNASVHTVSTVYYASLHITAGSLTIGAGQSNIGVGLDLYGGSLIPLDGASIVGGALANHGTTPFIIPVGVTLGMKNTEVYGPVENDGTLNVSGQVQMVGSGIADTNSGTINVSAGGTLSVGGSSFTLTNSGAVNVATGGVFQPTGGEYIQSAGVTTVDGTMTAAPVLQGGLLAGTGTVTGFTQTAGTVRPGDAGGTLTINGNYALNGGTLAVVLNGPAASSQGELKVTGGVTLGGALNLSVGYVAGSGDKFVIVDNSGPNPVSGQFTGLPDGATLTAGGQAFRISYFGGDGNDVTLTRLGSATDAIWDGASRRRRHEPTPTGRRPAIGSATLPRSPATTSTSRPRRRRKPT